MANQKSRREPPERLPVKLEAVSNGEYFPRRRDGVIDRISRLAFARADENARRLGVSRREFLRSSAGTATVLLTMNQVLGCGGGQYELRTPAELDEAAAADVLEGDELVLDVQTHHVSTTRPWAEDNEVVQFLADSPHCETEPWVECYSRDEYVREVFLDSDTDVAVLSALPGPLDAIPLLAQEAAETRDAIERMEGSPRLRIHGIVLPNAGDAQQTGEHMQSLVEEWNIAAWKLYPLWAPEGGSGYFLDDPEVGLPTIQRAVDLGVRTFAVHKGLPLPHTQARFSSPRDIGPVARMFPNVDFIVYHAGFFPEHREGPYDPDSTHGVDVLIRSLHDSGIAPNSNVWADLGSTWRILMSEPDQAAHVLGKLLTHVGEDRVLWGTDAIYYGSPQDQIQAFRAFQISPELREQHEYSALTRERKRKILGLNGAAVYGLDAEQVRRAVRRDAVARAREIYRHEARPSFATYGPRTRREVMALWRWRRGLPA